MTSKPGNGSVAGDVAGWVADAASSTLALNPLVGIRRRDLLVGGGALLKAMATSPRQVTRLLGSYLGELRKVIAGTSDAMPDPRDRRFADPAWQSNFLCRRLMQAHGVTQRTLADLIERSSLDARGKRRAQFFTSLLADALAPSNWLVANPAALRKIVETGGGSVVAGLRNMADDIRHNHMLPSQVDRAPFKVGVDVARTPGQVVHRGETFELIQYAPGAARVHSRPLVMSPPQINKYYAIDLAPEKSLAKWAVDSGVQLFVVAWRNPTAAHRDWGLPRYVQALDEAVDVARGVTRSPDVNMWGSCSGGVTLAAYLGWLAARRERKVAHTTWAVCSLDMRALLDESALGLFTTPKAIRAAKDRSRRRGFIGGPDMARVFAWMRANDLIWNYWVNNYLLGQRPPAFDILFWNNDTTRLPARFHGDLLDIVETNPFASTGTTTICGLPVDLGHVQVGAYVIAGITDHITPWRGCYSTARLLGPGSTFVLANAGHLQSLVNPPGAPKSFFLAAPAEAADPDAWATAARPSRTEGSWWPHWRAWIQERSGELVDAPKELGSPEHPPLSPAPGTYVHES